LGPYRRAVTIRRYMRIRNDFMQFSKGLIILETAIFALRISLLFTVEKRYLNMIVGIILEEAT